MFGFPKRQQTPRRTAPVRPRFDPSSDPLCTGWWRADRGVIANENAAVASWASIIPPYQSFVPASGMPAIAMPRLTNGYPAVATLYGSSSYSATNIAQDDDRAMTLTYVSRWPYGNSFNWNTYLYLSGHNLQMATWDGWLRVWAGDWRGWINGWWYPGSLGSVSVITARVRPIASDDLRQQWYFNFNNQQGGPFVNDVVATGSTATELRINSQYRSAMFWHELIYVRRFLSDSEVVAMHSALLQQYAVGV